MKLSTATFKGPKDVTRHIGAAVERELWVRAAGRCEFSGCNRLLYKSAVTQESVNIAQMAHIYSFSAAGPRGRGPYSKNSEGLNNVSNLMLVCYDCHRKIDKDRGGSRYSAPLLKSWKEEHELRVRVVTGITSSKKSHVLIYGSRVGDEHSPLDFKTAAEAMFPDSFPVDDRAIDLSMTCSHNDSTPEFWTSEAAHLRKQFDREVRNRSEEANPNHFSVFALAPQPLLMLLGSLLTDKVPAVVYQLHREPRTWKWQPHPENSAFQVVAPDNKTGTPALVVALSAAIDSKRVSSVISGPMSIWQLTVSEPHNDFLQSGAQLAMFRQAARSIINAIEAAHPGMTQLSIFPAMPIACAIEFGRIRMPKANRPWRIYDQNNKQGKFIPTLEIGAPQ